MIIVRVRSPLLTPDLPRVDIARRRASEAARLLLSLAPAVLRVAATDLFKAGKAAAGFEVTVVAAEDPLLTADVDCKAALPDPDNA
jgi:hypothetical protein